MLHVLHSQSAQNYLGTCSCFLTHPKPWHFILKGHCLVCAKLLRATGGSFPKWMCENSKVKSQRSSCLTVFETCLLQTYLWIQSCYTAPRFITQSYYVISLLDQITFINLLLLKHTQVPLAWVENFQVLQPLASLAQTKELEHDPLPPTTQKADETSS